MRARLLSCGWIALACVALGACYEDRPGTGTDTAAVSGSTATNVSLTLNPRVLPDGTTTVTVSADLAGSTTGVKLAFTGDRLDWPNADLLFVSKSGKRFTFRGTLRATDRIGRHDLSWRFQLGNGTQFGAPVTGAIEVTCSDGVFCNGEERYTKYGCVASPPPCNDGVACTVDTCNEAAKSCSYDPQGNNCDECDNGNCNTQCKPHWQCGDDGCGGNCTSAATDAAGKCTNGGACIDHTCQNVVLPGTCAAPLPLFGASGSAVPATGLETVVYGDDSTGIDAIQVSCGGAGIKELVYKFDVTVPMGLDIRVLAADGNPDDLDTVMAVLQSDCATQTWPGFCADDSSPPGGLGSRVFGPVEPGSYRLVVTGYSSNQVGPFQLQIKFVPGCVPQCDGKYCGPDGCGGDCGDCATGQQCSTAGRCFTAPCTPSCNGQQCGDDGCGGSCGTCNTGDLCAADGKCVAANTCDHLKPVCKSCDGKSYCGSDCECHKVTETLVDLVPAPAADFTPTIEFEWRSFDSASCALNEQCVPGPGRWLLMRFATDVLNQGLAGFTPPPPTSAPDIFTYDDCHQHFHFSGFANFRLLAWNGNTQLAGHKLSYCMEDSFRHLSGPNIPCNPGSDCANQGIQAGWADSYPAALDCQWLVLRGSTPAATDVPTGQWYWQETCTNVGRVFPEASFENNCVRVPVYIPDVPDNGTVVKYSDLALPPMP